MLSQGIVYVLAFTAAEPRLVQRNIPLNVGQTFAYPDENFVRICQRRAGRLACVWCGSYRH